MPLNPEDFEILKDFLLKKQKWTEKNMYAWLVFWINAINKRWAYDYDSRFVFFGYDKFFYKNTHQFFYYIFRFITIGIVFQRDPKGKEPLPIDINGDVIKKFTPKHKTQPDCLAIITGDAMIRLSFHIYGKGGRVVKTRTINQKTIVNFTYEEDPRTDIFSFQQKISNIREKQRWKRVFQYTINEIDTEVRFRPGMCGMEECYLSFMNHTKNL